MAQDFEIDQIGEIPQLLSLEAVRSCGGACSPDACAAASENLKIFCQWWLSEGQRSVWGVHTTVHARPKDRNKVGYTLRFVQPGRRERVPAVLILFQHWKPYEPHFQLQVPNRDLGNSLSNEKLKAKVMELKEVALGVAERFWVPDRRSSSLHEPLPNEMWSTLKDTISRMVVGLHALDWSV